MRLRLALLRGALRSGPGSTGRRVGLAVGAVLGAFLAVAASTGLAASAGHGRQPEDLAVLLFTGLLVGWVVLPVLTFAGDDLLDPGKLALLPLSRRQLLVVMGVGALVGVAPVATTVAALGLLPATGHGPASYAVALASVVLLLALCVSASRATAAALSGLLRSRRGRDLGVALAALVGISVQLVNPLVQVVVRRGGADQEVLQGLAQPLRWTPPGLLATAPGRSLPLALASLLAVAAVVGVLLVLWERSVRRSLERPDASGPRRRRSTALAPRLLPLPPGRVGAVAAKDLRYLGREPRRTVAMVFSVLVPLLAVLGPGLVSTGGLAPGFVFAVVGLGLFAGLSGANRFGLDGTATWLLLSSATDARDARRDLLGGDLATAVVSVPAALLLAVVLAGLTGGWQHVAPALGLALGLLGIVLGLADLLAVTAAYPVPESQSAFGGGGGSAGQGCAAGLLTVGAMLAAVLLALPMLGLLLPALLSGQGTAWGLALLALGPAYGLAVGAALRRAAARRWAQRAPEVLHVLAAAG